MKKNCTRWAPIVALGVVTIAVACAKPDTSQGSVDTTSASSTTTGAATVLAQTPYAFKRLNESNQPIYVDVAVDSGAIIVNPDSPPPKRTALATFASNGPGKEKVYHFDPKGLFTYVLYADSIKYAKTNTTQWSIDRVTPSGQHATFSHGGFHDCKDGPHNAKPNAGFKKCGVLPWWPDSTGGNASSTVKTSSMMSSFPMPRIFARIAALFQNGAMGKKKDDGNETDPAWAACTGGCCTLAS